MPFEWLTKVKVEEGTEVGFTPGYEEGTDNPEKKRGSCVHGLARAEPDESANLGTLIFGEPLAVDAAGKLAITWGHLKKFSP